MHLISVLFAQPEGPMRAITFFSGTEKVTFSIANAFPYFTDKLFVSIIGLEKLIIFSYF